MIIFFYGEDTYRLHQKIKTLKERFISASLGDTNLAILDGGKVTFDEFTRQILAMPFLAKTRLVIVENIMKGKSASRGLDKIPEALKKVPSSTVLVFVEEGIPDRRTSLFKRLSKEKLEEFHLLEPDQLRRWINREVENRKSKIEPEGVSKLIDYIGSDLWRMVNEIDKLIAYSGKITPDSIDLLVNPQIQSNIFDLIDKIALKNLTESERELYKLLNTGENEIYILSMIVYQYRNLLIIKDFEERIGKNRWAIVKKAGLHPFVVGKCQILTSRYTLDELKKIYRNLLDVDFKIKTGRIESRAALELLIFELCK